LRGGRISGQPASSNLIEAKAKTPGFNSGGFGLHQTRRDIFRQKALLAHCLSMISARTRFPRCSALLQRLDFFTFFFFLAAFLPAFLATFLAEDFFAAFLDFFAAFFFDAAFLAAFFFFAFLTAGLAAILGGSAGGLIASGIGSLTGFSSSMSFPQGLSTLQR
jgi:hypothetical protein